MYHVERIERIGSKKYAVICSDGLIIKIFNSFSEAIEYLKELS
jgi:hypothetical protein